MTDRELKAILEGAKLIPLTQSKWAILDAEDFEIFSQWTWCAVKRSDGKGFYASRSIRVGARRTKYICMHRLILDCPKNKEVDHKNRDGLDNRRENLRVSTHAQNMRNRTHQCNNKLSAKGVSFENNRYRARIKINGQYVNLGRFDSLPEAKHAYAAAAIAAFGEYAGL